MARPISDGAAVPDRRPHAVRGAFRPGRNRIPPRGLAVVAAASAGVRHLVEFRNLTNVTLPKAYRKPNGEPGRQSARLVDALDYFGIRDAHGYTITEKTEMQNVAIRGAPFTEQEKRDLLCYCEADVESLAPLLERLLTHIRAKRRAPGAPPADLSRRSTAAGS